jgi:hypothetical protein
MTDWSVADLCLFSRALERVMRSIPANVRIELTTEEMADTVYDLATSGIRDEKLLAEMALHKLGSTSCSAV